MYGKLAPYVAADIMTPRELFVTALRVIGVLQLIRAFDYAVEVFDIYSGITGPL